MESLIVHRAAFTVMGVQVRCNPKTADFEDIWHRFLKHQDQIKPLSTDGACYGVSVPCGGTAGHEIDYLAGMAVANVGDVPEGLAVREVPAARYAVFTCSLPTFAQTFARVFEEWLPASPYEREGGSAIVEQYPPDMTPDGSPVFLHIPLQPKT